MKKDYAQEFKMIVKENVEPYLKELGFKKKGNNFKRTSGDFVQVFNVQQSQFNFADDKTFTFNLGLYNEEIFLEVQDCEPPAFPKEYDCLIRLRSGELIDGTDKWFDLNTKTDIAKLKMDVSNVMTNRIIPFFQSYTTLKSVDELLERNETIRQQSPVISRIVLFLKLGKNDEAERLFKKEYKNAISPKEYKRIINKPDGTTEEYVSKLEVNKGFIELLENIAERYSIEFERRG